MSLAKQNFHFGNPHSYFCVYFVIFVSGHRMFMFVLFVFQMCLIVYYLLGMETKALKSTS